MRQYQVQVFSSNYALCGDMSRRVTWYLGQVTPGVESYSIDEVFLDLALPRWQIGSVCPYHFVLTLLRP
jgi:DNA polymerase V